jgi:hypothetical protein
MNPQNKNTHWHNVYGANTARKNFNRFLKQFPDIARDAKKRKIEILNVSPNSAIEVFPKVSLKDVL